MRESLADYYSFLLRTEVAQRLSRQVFQLLVHVFHRQVVARKRAVDFTISQLHTELGIHRRTIREAIEVASEAGLLKHRRTRGRNSKLVLACLPPTAEHLEKFGTIPTFWGGSGEPRSLGTNAQTSGADDRSEEEVWAPVPKQENQGLDTNAQTSDGDTHVWAPVPKHKDDPPAFLEQQPPVRAPVPKHSPGLSEQDF